MNTFRFILAIWIGITLLIAAMLWLRTMDVEAVEDPAKATIHLRIAEESIVSLETDSQNIQSHYTSLRLYVTVGFVFLSAASGNSIRLVCSRNLMRWLDGPARVSVLGGFLMLGAATISASQRFLSPDIQIHFFVWLFGFLLVFGLIVLHLAAWRDFVEGKKGAFALISRFGIEAIAWIVGLVGALGVAGALAIKFLAIFVR